MYDHSIRVPLFVAGPSLPKGRTNSNAVYLQDVMATALDMADISKPSFVEFNSLLPQINDASLAGNYNKIYGCYTDTQRMIKQDSYKLIAYPNAGKLRLFNLEEDPLEMKDLAEDANYDSKLKEMFGDLQSLQSLMGDTLVLDWQNYGG